MTKTNAGVFILAVAAFLSGMWLGDSLRSPAVAQPAAAQKPPLFQEVVVPDKTGEQGAVYLIYHGSGQICTPSQWVVPLKAKVEKAETEKPEVKKDKAKPPTKTTPDKTKTSTKPASK